MRYLPLYIHRFPLCAPRRLQEAQQLHRRYRKYEEIDNVPDRLRWLRYSKGLTQSEVAQRMGITRVMYGNIESGITQHIPAELVDKLAAFYQVPQSDFPDAFRQFLSDGQAQCIRAYRDSLGMSQKQFARYANIPLTSLRAWESGQKIISRQSWEKYFQVFFAKSQNLRQNNIEMS